MMKIWFGPMIYLSSEIVNYGATRLIMKVFQLIMFTCIMFLIHYIPLSNVIILEVLVDLES